MLADRLENQENIPPSSKPLAGQRNEVRKPGQPSSNRFSNILQDATNQIREEWDEQYAADKQVEEAVVLVEEWVMQTKDAELARQMSAAFDKEAKAEQNLQAIRGEAAAIQIAVEERRRVKAAAEARAKQEAVDAALAQRLLEEDGKEDSKEEQVHADAKYAESLASCVSPAKEEKSRSPPRPVITRESLRHGSEQLDCKEHKEERKGAGCVDEADFELARAEQKAWAYAEECRRFRQSQQDYELSRKLAISDARAAFQRSKRMAMEACYERCLRDEGAVARLWESATAEVEDVQGAVALTLLLPNIQKLTVTLLKNGHTLRIEALRLVLGKEVQATPVNSSFIAEFQLEGGGLRIAAADVTHSYSSESGLLHVFIEDVNIDDDGSEGSSKEAKQPAGDRRGGQGSGSGSGGSFFRAMAAGFGRVIFGGAAAQGKQRR